MSKKSKLIRNLTFRQAKVRSSFPNHVMDEIERAIAAAEAIQSCEIRFVVEGRMPLRFLRQENAVRQRAVHLFSELRIWDTEGNNGILFYVILSEQRFELVADRAVAKVVTDSDWQAIGKSISGHFAAGFWKEGVLHGIQELAACLKPHFPPGGRSELSNRPIVLE